MQLPSEAGKLTIIPNDVSITLKKSINLNNFYG